MAPTGEWPAPQVLHLQLLGVEPRPGEGGGREAAAFGLSPSSARPGSSAARRPAAPCPQLPCQAINPRGPFNMALLGSNREVLRVRFKWVAGAAGGQGPAERHASPGRHPPPGQCLPHLLLPLRLLLPDCLPQPAALSGPGGPVQGDRVRRKAASARQRRQSRRGRAGTQHHGMPFIPRLCFRIARSYNAIS